MTRSGGQDVAASGLLDVHRNLTTTSTAPRDDGRTTDRPSCTTDPAAPPTQLHQGLKQRHLTMIAIGGVIGAGLFVGSGVVINGAGPAAFLSYANTGVLIIGIVAVVRRWGPSSQHARSWCSACLPVPWSSLFYVVTRWRGKSEKEGRTVAPCHAPFPTPV